MKDRIECIRQKKFIKRIHPIADQRSVSAKRDVPVLLSEVVSFKCWWGQNRYSSPSLQSNSIGGIKSDRMCFVTAFLENKSSSLLVHKCMIKMNMNKGVERVWQRRFVGVLLRLTFYCCCDYYQLMNAYAEKRVSPTAPWFPFVSSPPFLSLLCSSL